MFDDEPVFESREEFRQWRDMRNHERWTAAVKQAENEAEKIDWTNNKTHLKDALANLGSKIGDEYTNLIEMNLDGEITEGCHNKAMCAERLLWIAERQADISKDSFTSGFGNTSGAFFNQLDFLTEEGAIQIKSFDKWYHPMLSISLVFFNQADDLMQKSRFAEALDKVAEAFIAKGYHDYMLWCEIGGEDKQSSIYSQNGKSGANKRHAAMKELRDWTIKQYQAGSWIDNKKSANKAAHDLKETVLAHGRTIGAHLTEENAQRTISEWIRKSA